MIESAALPIGQQILIILVGPPIMAGLWWLGSRGFGGVVQGRSVSERTKSRQKKGVLDSSRRAVCTRICDHALLAIPADMTSGTGRCCTGLG